MSLLWSLITFIHLKDQEWDFWLKTVEWPQILCFSSSSNPLKRPSMAIWIDIDPHGPMRWGTENSIVCGSRRTDRCMMIFFAALRKHDASGCWEKPRAVLFRLQNPQRPQGLGGPPLEGKDDKKLKPESLLEDEGMTSEAGRGAFCGLWERWAEQPEVEEQGDTVKKRGSKWDFRYRAWEPQLRDSACPRRGVWRTLFWGIWRSRETWRYWRGGFPEGIIQPDVQERSFQCNLGHSFSEWAHSQAFEERMGCERRPAEKGPDVKSRHLQNLCLCPCGLRVCVAREPGPQGQMFPRGMQGGLHGAGSHDDQLVTFRPSPRRSAIGALPNVDHNKIPCLLLITENIYRQ